MSKLLEFLSAPLNVAKGSRRYPLSTVVSDVCTLLEHFYFKGGRILTHKYAFSKSFRSSIRSMAAIAREMRASAATSTCTVPWWEEKSASIISQVLLLKESPTHNYSWHIDLNRPLRSKGIKAGRRLTAARVLNLIIDVCNLPVREDEEELDWAALEAMVPSQQIAPLAFLVQGGVIRRIKPFTMLETSDRANISMSLELILQKGEELLADQGLDNYERRLRQSIRAIHTDLRDEESPLKVGLENIGLEKLLSSLSDELTSSAFGAILGYMTMVETHIAQFPEWQMFSSKSMELKADQANIDTLVEATEFIVGQTSNYPDIAEPDVPAEFEFLLSLVHREQVVQARAIYCLAKSLENFVAAVLTYKIEEYRPSGLLRSVRKKPVASDRLFEVAIGASNALRPSSGKLVGGWMKRASDLLAKTTST